MIKTRGNGISLLLYFQYNTNVPRSHWHLFKSRIKGLSTRRKIEYNKRYYSK